LQALETRYTDLYTARHAARQAAFAEAIETVRAQPRWVEVPEAMRADVLRPLTDRACEALALAATALTCDACGAGLAQMASDLAAVDGLRTQVLVRVQSLTAPEEKVERVRIADVVGVGTTLSTEDEVASAVADLEDHLLRLIAQGVKVVVA
jgi:hypothetical protein